ncbi:hypothetical protein CEXT_336871 [Caerostris extrusa]|uniref:Uncharacterized protein n=1 Tax=Caerostris extrusa TaxID=172846 RepID=A0AAV4SCF7_CAEEX|nr:hypothetical protein CEXT_336871 [Caerostris extrusa]
MLLQQKVRKIIRLLNSSQIQGLFCRASVTHVPTDRILKAVRLSRKRMRHGTHDCPRKNPSVFSTKIPICQVICEGEESEQLNHFKSEHV